MVVSAMFTLRARAWIAEAWTAGANGVRIEAPRFGSEGRSSSSDQGQEQGVRQLGDAAVEICIVIL